MTWNDVDSLTKILDQDLFLMFWKVFDFFGIFMFYDFFGFFRF